MPDVYDDMQEIVGGAFSPDSCDDRDRHRAVIMAGPEYFDVTYELPDNVFMDQEVDVDTDRAREQWEDVKGAYGSLDVETYVVEGVEDLPDMVFAANHGLAHNKNGQNYLVPATMRHEDRAPEVDYLADWCGEHDYELLELGDTYAFEGEGDAIWHPGKELLWGGYGRRTDQDVYKEIADEFDTPVIMLEPGEPWFHLDTAFTPLTQDTAMMYRDAFSEEDQTMIDAVFDTVIEVPFEEAAGGLAANAHSPDGDHVILNSGNTQTMEQLEAHGFSVIPVDTSEFLKAGGSVHCLRLSLPE